MTDPATALTEMLGRRTEDQGIAGLAFAIGPSATAEVVWRPRTLAEEPGFLVYSITKTFTAVLMLSLQQSGGLSLDDPLARWLPHVAASDRISLRRLLNHTAGVPDYGGLPSYQEAVRTSPTEPWSFERFAAETIERGLLFDPGAGWAYSNPGYMLLKRVAEAVSGESYATSISDRIARPLGLRRTFVAESLADLSSLAAAPSAALSPDGRKRDARAAYHPGWVSHGVVASTPSEIVRFFAGIFRGGLLSSESLREMTAFVAVPSGPPRWRKPSYGLGLMGDPESPWGAVWGHSGGGPGYSSSAFHAPALRGLPVTVCAMCAIEEDCIAEELVMAAFDLIRGG
jgi:D-alanyl-D-alanine carboxypeptidase